MKTIALPAFTTHDPRNLLRLVLETPTVQDGQPVPITVSDMRRRLRILDAIEEDGAVSGPIALEDADYEVLNSLLVKFPFATAHRDIVALADSVELAR